MQDQMTIMSPVIRDIMLDDALRERYLAYAMSTITARSLPDVRDGLKPVHRRLLYAMRQLRLAPNEGFKKSARVVGDVMGKFHPHGDSAIYDAMVRLAQDFSQRYPLVDGQGNFGSIDGDNAAAMRYTEARLTLVAQLLLEGIDEDAVDFRDTYDGEGREPVVLPAAFPNLLANGTQGIAVGMATAIPPHNVDELCSALDHLIEHPDAAAEDLVEHVRGPDFPTGGVLASSRDEIIRAYRTGRGTFRLRARWEIEKGRAGTYRIIVTEIPFQVQKARLVEKLAELLETRKVALLGDISDESAGDLRLVLEPKNRNVEPQMLMESLFRLSELETGFTLNLNVLDAEHTPRVMSLRAALQAFLEHRLVVLLRRSRHRLARIENRLEILEGFRIAFLNLDAVIAIIREDDDPKAEMIRRWRLSDVQAEAILNMRLRALRRLEEIEINREHEDLSAERLDIRALLEDRPRCWQIIRRQIAGLRENFGRDTELGRRRTEIGPPVEGIEIPAEAVIEREPVTIICSAMGWIRAVRGHLDGDASLKFKDGDESRFLVPAQTTDRVLVLSSNGRFFTIAVDRLPRGRGHGEPLRLMVDLPDDQDIVALKIHRPDQTYLLASDDGRGFRVRADDAVAQTRTGRQVMTTADGARAAACIDADGDTVAVVDTNRKLLLFPLEDVPVLTRGKGVILQRCKGSSLADIRVFRATDGLSWRMKGGRQRTETNLTPWQGKRGGSGRQPPTGFPRPARFT